MHKPRGLGIIILMGLTLALEGLGADKPLRPAVMGSLEGVRGAVQVDHQPVRAREVVVAGDILSTGASSGVRLDLSAGSTATLVENSEMALSGSRDAATLTLTKGALVIHSGMAQTTRVGVRGASVLVGGAGTFPSVCRIAAAGISSVIIADKGYIEIHGAGAPRVVAPGKTVRLENGVPQGAAQPEAGKVEGELPTGTVQHQGRPAIQPLNLNDTVYWQDTVNTVGNGRVRIKLNGGSTLLVGARSSMVIRKHDEQSQQTDILLTAGKLRGEVNKLTQPGASFKTTTPTAVIGVVGTTFIGDATNPNATDVYSVEGDVSVSNSDANVLGTVILHTGQFTRVLRGLAPAAAVTATAAQMATKVSQTNISPGAATQAATSASSAAGSTAGAVRGVTSIGAAGASVGVGAVVVNQVNNASTNAQAAGRALASAAAAANQAATDAGNAQNASNAASAAAAQANSVATAAANAITQSQQGCGCVSPSTP